MSRTGEDLGRRFLRRLDELDAPRPGEGAVVAVSGGVDSLVLLHLLRFVAPSAGAGRENEIAAPDQRAPPRDPLVAAHLDHRMRPDSGSDALWLRGLFRSWQIPSRFSEADRPPKSEGAARDARYRFLEEVREEVGARWILTAHHADDHAETVLFRILRGTGLKGLGGIPERREPGILRPLLPYWKDEIRSYARSAGIRPRTDRSNVDRRFARNVIRHDVLPRIEESVAPGARRALVRLADLARREEAGWKSLEADLRERVVERSDSGELVLSRDSLLELHPEVRARLLRSLLQEAGIRLDEAGTRGLLAFTSEGVSGGRWELPGGRRLAREFDRFVLRGAGSDAESGAGEGAASDRSDDNDPLEIESPGPGHGRFRVGGRVMTARWGPDESVSGEWIASFTPSELIFPLRVRNWIPGDRIRLAVGSKKLKKLFGEGKIPVKDRHRWPVVADGEGAVLWLPGLARSEEARPARDEDGFRLGIGDAGGS